MATTSLSTFLKQLAHGMAAETLNEQTDRQLVEQFLARREAAAFEAIVRRHGAMVYRVCLRLPLILCYLQGRTQEEAAGRLGWSKSTLRRRLEEARDALGCRLKGRGLVWSAAFSAVLLSDCRASAALPSGLVGSTAQAATLVTAGRAAASVVSPRVVRLTEGMAKTMFVKKLKMAAILCVAKAAMIPLKSATATRS